MWRDRKHLGCHGWQVLHKHRICSLNSLLPFPACGGCWQPLLRCDEPQHELPSSIAHSLLGHGSGLAVLGLRVPPMPQLSAVGFGTWALRNHLPEGTKQSHRTHNAQCFGTTTWHPPGWVSPRQIPLSAPRGCSGCTHSLGETQQRSGCLVCATHLLWTQMEDS